MTALLNISCSSAPQNSLVRVAILPATVLTTDPALAWTSRGLPVVLYQDLSTSHKVAPVLAANDSIGYGTNAARILRTSIDSYHNRLIVKATLTDVRTQKTLADYTQESKAQESFIQSADRLAQQIAADAGPFSTRNDKALFSYAEAFATTVPQQQLQFLDEAARTDPAFGLAQNTLVEIVAGQSPAQAQQVLARAQPHRGQFTPVDRARFDLQAARLKKAPLPEVSKLVTDLLALAPGDLSALLMLAQLNVAENKVSDAVGHLTEALSIDPGNIQARQLLAGAYLSTHQDEAARKTVEELHVLRPEDPNVKRMVAEVEFSTGHFAEAEQAYKALNDLPATMGMAVCRMLAGDLNGAQVQFERAATLRAKDPLLPLGRATWTAFTGDRAKAIQMLTSTRFPNPDYQSVALSQAAIYQVLNKNAVQAQHLAEQSMTLAQSNVPKSFAIVSSLIAHGSEPAAQFQARVQGSELDPNGKALASAYGYFFAGRYNEALPEWEALLKRNPGEFRIQVMRAATLNRMGRTAEAAKDAPGLLMPNLAGGDELAVPSFAEAVRLRALAERQAGKADLAATLTKAIALYHW